MATWLDSQLWGVLEAAAGFQIPRQVGNRGWDCGLEVPGREGKTFQEWVVRQPIKMGGLGLRSLAETCSVAYLSSLEKTILSFAGENGI